MSYCLTQDEPVGEGIRRVVGEQIESAIKGIDDRHLPRRDAVHKTRQHCKRIRGALRLIRFSFDVYCSENARFRDLARELSAIREAEVLRDTQRELLDEVSVRADRSAELNRALAPRFPSEDADGALEVVRARLVAGRVAAIDWRIDGDDFEAIEDGLHKSYELARKSLPRCQREATADNLHEWRKRVKYHWCHLRLLTTAWPKVIKARAVAGHHLTALLGDHHDLAVYVDAIEEVDDVAPANVVKALRLHADERREALLEESLVIGMRLFVEEPGDFTARFESYWRAWRTRDADHKP